MHCACGCSIFSLIWTAEARSQRVSDRKHVLGCSSQISLDIRTLKSIMRVELINNDAGLPSAPASTSVLCTVPFAPISVLIRSSYSSIFSYVQKHRSVAIEIEISTPKRVKRRAMLTALSLQSASRQRCTILDTGTGRIVTSGST